MSELLNGIQRQNSTSSRANVSAEAKSHPGPSGPWSFTAMHLFPGYKCEMTAFLRVITEFVMIIFTTCDFTNQKI